MQPILEIIPRPSFESITVDFNNYKFFPTPWHFHPEFELVLITKGTGKRFIGDNISNFEPGNLALIGSNLPHTFKNDRAYYISTKKLYAQSIVVQFLDTALGKDFLALPEAAAIRQLLAKSARGLAITGTTREKVAAGMHELVNLTGLHRWLKMVVILQLLAEREEYAFISTNNITGSNINETERMDNVLKYLVRNLSNDIRLSTIAKTAHMTDNAFSKFFKKRTKKTFTEYLSELRLNHAARLLIEQNESVEQVGYSCGYNNLSNFYRRFKQHYGRSPLNFRKEYLGKAQ